MLKRWPWIFIVILFLLSSGGAIWFTVIAIRNTPDTIPLENLETSENDSFVESNND